MTSKKYAALIAPAAIVAALAAWFADPVSRVLGIATAAAMIWLVAARFVVAAQHEEAPSATLAGYRTRLAGLIDHLAALGQMQSLSSRSELDQLKGMLQQAIDQLIGNFQNMNSHVQAQHELALSIVNGVARIGQEGESMRLADCNLATADAARGIDAHAAAVASEVGAAVIALQFQDLSSQLISHVQGRLEGLSEGVQGVAQSFAGAADMDSAMAAARERIEALSRLQHTRKNPVEQESMRSGDIELL